MKRSTKLPNTATYKAAELRTREFHASQNKTFSGQFTWKKRKQIKEIIDKYEIKSILDYGCGKGKQYNTNLNLDDGKSLEEYWGIVTTKYDPGVQGFESEPVGIFDLVICVQVLGSIPLPDLPVIINRLYGFAEKAIFVTERIGMPHKRVYKGMEDIMPRGLSMDDWMELLRREDTDVKMICAFRKDGTWHDVEL